MPMYSRAQSLLLVLLPAIASLISCSQERVATGTSPDSKPLPAGFTGNLTRSDVTTLAIVDNIGPVSNPAAQQHVEVSGDKTFGITGWAVDDPKKALAGGVDVVIDQTPYSAHYGSSRPDVAAHFNQPAYGSSGFELMIAPGQLAKGQHSASIRVISNDKKMYYQGPVVQFAVN